VRSGRRPNEGVVTGDERVRLAESFGARLVAERRRIGLTQDALAARAGYSEAHVARLERGERRPTDSTTWRLAKAITETRKGNKASMVELDVRLMVAAGESLRLLYRTRPRLRWQRLAQQALELEQARQKNRERFAALTEEEQLEATVNAMFDSERHAPR
jgi:transcriptional regulator with XRE-family HTH domain